MTIASVISYNYLREVVFLPSLSLSNPKACFSLSLIPRYLHRLCCIPVWCVCEYLPQLLRNFRVLFACMSRSFLNTLLIRDSALPARRHCKFSFLSFAPFSRGAQRTAVVCPLFTRGPEDRSQRQARARRGGARPPMARTPSAGGVRWARKWSAILSFAHPYSKRSAGQMPRTRELRQVGRDCRGFSEEASSTAVARETGRKWLPPGNKEKPREEITWTNEPTTHTHAHRTLAHTSLAPVERPRTSGCGML